MRSLLLAMLLLTLAIAGCADSSDDQAGADSGPEGTDGASATTVPPPRAAQTIEVMAMNNQFSPQEATIRVGDSVRWVDHDAANPHNVVSTSAGNEFRSPDMDAALPTYARDYTHTFEMAGTVDYVCEYHNGMVGTLVVEA